jgi:hypothetical protein
MKFELTYDETDEVPLLTFNDYVKVGKNSCSFLPYEDKLFVCAIGGMQKPGAPNPETGLWVVDASTSSPLSVSQVVVPTMPATIYTGDFRDISITDDGYAYLLIGYFNGSYTSFIGNVLGTSVTNLLSNPASAYTLILPINDPGDLWSIYAESDPPRLWYIKGKAVDVYTSLPITQPTTKPISFPSEVLGGDQKYTALNSAVFIGADGTAPGTRHHKSTYSANRLAKEVRTSKQKLPEEEK